MATPRVFIGSSSEGIEAARAVRGLLRKDAECKLWNEGFFRLGEGFLESLVNRLDTFDFAILIATPDDDISSRKVRELAPRDNVLFELGLFMGHLGRERTFLICPTNVALKIPSDLAGVSNAGFDWPEVHGHEGRARLGGAEWQDLLGASCDEIRSIIRHVGGRQDSANVQRAIQEQQRGLREQQERLTEQEKKLNQLVIYSMSITIYKHLWGLNEARKHRGTYFYRHNPIMQREMYYLRDHGYIATVAGGFPEFEAHQDGQDLAHHLQLTPAGEFLVELRGKDWFD
jgi:hypothetical protein